MVIQERSIEIGGVPLKICDGIMPSINVNDIQIQQVTIQEEIKDLQNKNEELQRENKELRDKIYILELRLSDLMN